jgi:hypothetical protein
MKYDLHNKENFSINNSSKSKSIRPEGEAPILGDMKR